MILNQKYAQKILFILVIIYKMYKKTASTYY